MAVTITTVDTNYFTLNGTRYAKIYVPLKGVISTEIGIYNSFDTCQQILNSTPFDEFTVDAVTGWIDEDALMTALLPVIYKYASVGGGGIGTIDWGNIGGTLSAQTDLDTALSNKSDVGHTHSFASLTSKPTTLAGFGITDAYTEAEVDSLLSAKADNSHTHLVADITDFSPTDYVPIAGGVTITGNISINASTTLNAVDHASVDNLTLKGAVADGYAHIFIDYNGNGSGFSDITFSSSDIQFNGVSLLDTGLESTDIDTLAELNAIVSDATLITDAPADSQDYVRSNNAWVVASGGGGGDAVLNDTTAQNDDYFYISRGGTNPALYVNNYGASNDIARFIQGAGASDTTITTGVAITYTGGITATGDISAAAADLTGDLTFTTAGIQTASYVGFLNNTLSDADNYDTEDYTAPAFSLSLTSNTTASLNHPTVFGQALWVKGAAAERHFSIYRSKGATIATGALYAGMDDGAGSWNWGRFATEMTPTFTADVGDNNLTWTLSGNQSVTLHLEADLDNVTETHNPLLKLSQDGGLKYYEVSLASATDDGLTGTASNDVYFRVASGSESFNWGNVATGTAVMNLDTSNGNLYIGSIQFNGGTEELKLIDGTTVSSKMLGIVNNNGYLELGCNNTSYAHFYTDRATYYFNKKISVDTGELRSHNEDLNLNRAGSTSARLRITSGVTYSDQDFEVDNHLLKNSSHRSGLLSMNYNASASWYGLQIVDESGQLFNIMADNDQCGLYDDTANEWGWIYKINSALTLYYNGSVKMSTTSTGITVTGTGVATDWDSTSDGRLKDNIKALKDYRLTTNWVSYNWKDGGKADIGLIAQDLEITNPEFVKTDDKGMKSISYNKVLIAKQVENERIMQEQADRIDRLEALVEQLLKDK